MRKLYREENFLEQIRGVVFHGATDQSGLAANTGGAPFVAGDELDG